MSLYDGERQVAPELSGIRRDHLARYQWAAGVLPKGSRVIDAACGVGYGSAVLADAGMEVIGLDRSAEAIDYARQHFQRHGITHFEGDLEEWPFQPFDRIDAVVSFETIEHLADPLPVLRRFHDLAPRLLISVPNEERFPFRGQRFHHRHYTRAELSGLLDQAGFKIVAWHGQPDSSSEVEPEISGRTIVVEASRRVSGEVSLPPPAVVPRHVAIVGLGPSAKEYFELVKTLGGRRALCDEVWAINGLGDVLACDRVFHMDDLAVQEARAAAQPGSNIAAMVRWLKTHPGPVYTSTVRPGYPGLVAYPLRDVIEAGGAPYFNNTVAYAIAFARFIGVKKLSIYGVDFTRPNIHKGEQGRACCEFWLGLCIASGMEIDLPAETTLMDACAPDAERLYGYDGVEVIFRDGADGALELEMKPRDLPTAAEVEHRYDHRRHPNRLMQKEPLT